MVIAFDGVCVLCNGFVRFLLRRDRYGRMRFATHQSAAGAALFAATMQNTASPISVVLADGGNLYLESEAALRAIVALGGGWRVAAVLRCVPLPLRNAAYRWVARNRYHWFGKHEVCAVPEPDWARRFLP